MYTSKPSKCNHHLGSCHATASTLHDRYTSIQTDARLINMWQPSHHHMFFKQQQASAAQAQHVLASRNQLAVMRRHAAARNMSHAHTSTCTRQPTPQRVQAQPRGRPAGPLFQPCLDLVGQGNVVVALDVLRQLITAHGSPDRSDGDQVLLVGLPRLALSSLLSPRASCCVLVLLLLLQQVTS